MKTTILVLAITVTFISLKAQSTRFNDSKIGVGVGFRLNTDSVLNYTPTIQFYERNICLYAGPSLLVPIFNFDIYDRFGFCVGVDYLFPNPDKHKLDKYIQFDFTYNKYKFNSTLYDTAVPNIPISATIAHERRYENLSLNGGLTYHFTRNFYASGNAGIGGQWNTLIDPGTYAYYYSVRSRFAEGVASTSFKFVFAYFIEVGMYF